MTAHRMPVTLCPGCKTPLNAASNAQGDDKPPQHGDYTICAECTLYLRFERDALFGGRLTVRPITQEELLEMHPENLHRLMELRHLLQGSQP